MTISWSFSYNSFVKFDGKNFGSHNITMFYPNLYYTKVCYKGTSLYKKICCCNYFNKSNHFCTFFFCFFFFFFFFNCSWEEALFIESVSMATPEFCVPNVTEEASVSAVCSPVKCFRTEKRKENHIILERLTCEQDARVCEVRNADHKAFYYPTCYIRRNCLFFAMS